MNVTNQCLLYRRFLRKEGDLLDVKSSDSKEYLAAYRLSITETIEDWHGKLTKWKILQPRLYGEIKPMEPHIKARVNCNSHTRRTVGTDYIMKSLPYPSCIFPAVDDANGDL